MSPDPRDRLRRVASRLPTAAVAELGEDVRRRARLSLRRARTRHPAVSVVVLLHGEEDVAVRTLDSALAQDAPGTEVVVVAMQDHLGHLAEAAEAADPRVQVAPMLGEDWAAARRFGAVAARGRWLLHLSSGQLLLPGALDALLAAVDDAAHDDRSDHVGHAAGGTVALGALVDDPPPTEGGWARTPLLGRLLVPRDAWARLVDDAEPDGQTAAVALMVHGHRDVTATTLREHHHPHGHEPVDQPVTSYEELVSARVAQDRSALALLESVDLGDARRQRACGALARDLPPLLRRADPRERDTWSLLSRHAAELVDVAGDLLGEVPVEDRVAAWLAGQDRGGELISFLARVDELAGRLPTRVEDGEVHAELGGLEGLDGLDLPEGMTRLGDFETPLRTELVRARVHEDALHVELWAALLGVPDDEPGAAPAPEARSWWEGPPSAGTLEVPVDLSADPAVTRWAGETHQRHDRGVLRCEVGLGELAVGDWRLRVELAHQGVRRSALVDALDPHGSAARAVVADGRRFAFEHDPDGVLVLRVTPAPTDVSPHPAGVLVSGVDLETGRVSVDLDPPTGAEVLLEGVEGRAAGHRVVGVRREEGRTWDLDLVATHAGGAHPAPAPSGTYRLTVRSEGTELLVSLGDAVVDELPRSELDALRRTSLWGGPRGGLLVHLDPDLGDDEAGPWAQQQLQRTLRSGGRRPDRDLVYLERGRGEAPAGAVGEVLEGLLAGLPDGARVAWGVADSSVVVPDGCEAVLRLSWEWYDAVRGASCLVLDEELPSWFVPGDGQRVLLVAEPDAPRSGSEDDVAAVVRAVREQLG
ncbi:MAG: hypothetical protein JWR42_1768 [Marmoricola sp.]|nr:hypothetical protein [Marmoricola sp.]